MKQPDGQVQQANIVKLTDQSTYTVGEFHIGMPCTTSRPLVIVFLLVLIGVMCTASLVLIY